MRLASCLISAPAGQLMTPCAFRSLPFRANLTAFGFLRNFCRCRPTHDCLSLRFPASESKLHCLSLIAHFLPLPACSLLPASAIACLPETYKQRLASSADTFTLPLPACSRMPAPAFPCLPEVTGLGMASCADVCPCRPAHICLRLRFPACQSQLDCVWLRSQKSAPASRHMPACFCGSLPP
jgi:hypothetical protein